MAHRVGPTHPLHVRFEILNKLVNGHGGLMKRRVLENVAHLTRTVWRQEMSQVQVAGISFRRD